MLGQQQPFWVWLAWATVHSSPKKHGGLGWLGLGRPLLGQVPAQHWLSQTGCLSHDWDRSCDPAQACHEGQTSQTATFLLAWPLLVVKTQLLRWQQQWTGKWDGWWDGDRGCRRLGKEGESGREGKRELKGDKEQEDESQGEGGSKQQQQRTDTANENSIWWAGAGEWQCWGVKQMSVAGSLVSARPGVGGRGRTGERKAGRGGREKSSGSSYINLNFKLILKHPPAWSVHRRNLAGLWCPLPKKILAKGLKVT